MIVESYDGTNYIIWQFSQFFKSWNFLDIDIKQIQIVSDSTDFFV